MFLTLKCLLMHPIVETGPARTFTCPSLTYTSCPISLQLFCSSCLPPCPSETALHPVNVYHFSSACSFPQEVLLFLFFIAFCWFGSNCALHCSTLPPTVTWWHCYIWSVSKVFYETAQRAPSVSRAHMSLNAGR